MPPHGRGKKAGGLSMSPLPTTPTSTQSLRRERRRHTFVPRSDSVADLPAAIVNALQTLRQELSKDFAAQLVTLRDDLRREFSDRWREVKEEQTELKSRLTELERWRLHQLEQRGQDRADAVQRLDAVRTDVDDRISRSRTELDGRTIAQFSGWLIAVVTILAYLINAHITLH
jgi:DNA anti-recombination protein RmuC